MKMTIRIPGHERYTVMLCRRCKGLPTYIELPNYTRGMHHVVWCKPCDTVDNDDEIEGRAGTAVDAYDGWNREVAYLEAHK